MRVLLLLLVLLSARLLFDGMGKCACNIKVRRLMMMIMIVMMMVMMVV